MNNFINPLPEITRVSGPFYKAAKLHKLLFQHCRNCGKNIFYPKNLCPNCWSPDLEWTEASGKGKLYSYTVVHGAAPSAFKDAIPYVIGVIDLEEGVRMLSWVVECDIEQLKCDMDVKVNFRDLNDEIALPFFSPEK